MAQEKKEQVKTPTINKSIIQMMLRVCGRVVKNDGFALRLALEEYINIQSFRHSGNYVFCADLAKNKQIMVYTKPVNGEVIDDEIKIEGFELLLRNCDLYLKHPSSLANK